MTQGPEHFHTQVHNLPWEAAPFPPGRRSYCLAFCYAMYLKLCTILSSLPPSQGLWGLCAAPGYSSIVSHILAHLSMQPSNRIQTSTMQDELKCYKEGYVMFV